MKNWFLVGLVVVFFAVGCEKEEEIVWSDEVNIGYFAARGFNLRFVEVRTFEENIITDQTVYNVYRDITLNIADLLIVDKNDVITIGNEKVTSAAVWNADKTDLVHDPTRYPQLDAFNQIMVNCNRIPMTFNIDVRTTFDSSIDHHYKGSCVFTTEHTFTGPYIQGVPNSGLFVRFLLFAAEFEITPEGLFIVKMPAQYTLGVWEGERTLPLTGQQVQNIVENGVEGIDYQLFLRDNMVLVRIQNLLYQRRYNNWVLHSIADPHHTTAYIRNQSWIVFTIEDWDDIVAPYPSHIWRDGYRESVDWEKHKNLGGYVGDDRLWYPYGDPRDWETITTPTPCNK